jgi:hypothetical protein
VKTASSSEGVVWVLYVMRCLRGLFTSNKEEVAGKGNG